MAPEEEVVVAQPGWWHVLARVRLYRVAELVCEGGLALAQERRRVSSDVLGKDMGYGLK